ncbi:MAG TPA: gluconate 2-dehydrogenase subunit 3 family protein [Thermoanaerobaculia bacterium]|nr:gluconate 2-dehydrogenase subunit 3 family protein [Thermoanaerobaculia bacterium]
MRRSITMRRNWTRRGFLQTAAAGTFAATGAARAVAAMSSGTRPASSPFTARLRATLSAAMDEIIPASDGMPAASDTQVLRYLEQISASDGGVRRDVRRAAEALERRCRPRRFASLSAARRVEVMKALEKEEPAVFGLFRDYVYEGYYTNPGIWSRIGFEFYGPERPGPGMPAFDESAVARVRTGPPLYRKLT